MSSSGAWGSNKKGPTKIRIKKYTIKLFRGGILWCKQQLEHKIYRLYMKFWNERGGHSPISQREAPPLCMSMIHWSSYIFTP
jgi:hypothetical protein